ncbi:MAG: hypothetical protein EHM18_16245 [Acidobacteria bacterium]|nr:MAG: hypothetical protein EHM18_16245 [Acidobacteriota bacterium]
MATEFAITSPTGYPQVKVTLNCYSDDGAPWVVDLYSVDRPDAGGFKSSTTFTLAPSETVHFVTRATPSLASGWAILMTSHPVVASVSFQSVRTDVTPARAQWVAGVLPTPAAGETVFGANVSARDIAIGNPAVDVGFAIGNPNDLAAEVAVRLVARPGGPAVATEQVYVPARGHTSMFISELFKNVAWGDRFHGHVWFASEVPLTVLALKETTIGGSTVYSTLSVTPDHQLLRRVFYDREDNSSFAKAQPITSPAEVVGRRELGDAGDYFSIQVAPEDVTGNRSPVLYVFDAASADLSVLTYLLKLYDHDQNELVPEYSVGWANQAMISYRFERAGTYYLVRQDLQAYRMLVAVNRVVNP